MIVHKGHNVFHPLKPIWPFGKESLSYQFKIGADFYVDDLCEPLLYGLKLPAVGKFNYHNGGANWAIIHEAGKCFVYPRYYSDKLHELDYLKVEIQPDTWYSVKTRFNELTFSLDGNEIFTSGLIIPTGWLTPPYLGKRKVGVAKRELKLNISWHNGLLN